MAGEYSGRVRIFHCKRPGVSRGNESFEDEPSSRRQASEDIKLTIKQDSNHFCQDLALRFNLSGEPIPSYMYHLGECWNLSKWIPYDVNGRPLTTKIS